jgi:hypothetical protein
MEIKEIIFQLFPHEFHVIKGKYKQEEYPIVRGVAIGVIKISHFAGIPGNANDK